MSSKGEGMKCGVDERWYSHMEKMPESEMTEWIFNHGRCVEWKGTSQGKWEKGLLEYLKEGIKRMMRGFDQERRERKATNK